MKKQEAKGDNSYVPYRMWYAVSKEKPLDLKAGRWVYLVAGQTGQTGEVHRQETVLNQQMKTGEKCILYIGTKDKDTYMQLIPTEEARDKVNAICAKYVGGYTSSDAKGGWVDETDTLIQEKNY